MQGYLGTNPLALCSCLEQMTSSESVFSFVKGVRASRVFERTESVHVVGVLNAFNISCKYSDTVA